MPPNTLRDVIHAALLMGIIVTIIIAVDCLVYDAPYKALFVSLVGLFILSGIPVDPTRPPK